jgi:hypothetical protein
VVKHRFTIFKKPKRKEPQIYLENSIEIVKITTKLCKIAKNRERKPKKHTKQKISLIILHYWPSKYEKTIFHAILHKKTPSIFSQMDQNSMRYAHMKKNDNIMPKLPTNTKK